MFVIDLYCGLGGWTEGFLAEGFTVYGFDIERHQYGDAKYPAQLIIQDVLTIHGRQFKDATAIVASPPCTEPSYRAMPWKRAKALNAIGPPHKFIELFNNPAETVMSSIFTPSPAIPTISSWRRRSITSPCSRLWPPARTN